MMTTTTDKHHESADDDGNEDDDKEDDNDSNNENDDDYDYYLSNSKQAIGHDVRAVLGQSKNDQTDCDSKLSRLTPKYECDTHCHTHCQGTP